MKALGSGNRQRNQLQIPHWHLCRPCDVTITRRPVSPTWPAPLVPLGQEREKTHRHSSQPRYDNARVSSGLKINYALQINQLEIDETIPKRANYIPMHSKVTAVAIFYCWTGNPNDGQRRRGRKSKWAGAAGVGRPRRDRWRQHAADASRQTLSRTESGSVIATCAFSRSAAPPSISFRKTPSFSSLSVLARCHNAFSLIFLAIRDAGYLDRADSGDADDGLSLAFMCAAGKRKFPYAPITLSLGSTDIWSCLEDELRKIRDGPFTRYIPDLDCNTLHTQYPLPLAFRHLLKSDDQSTADDHPVAKG
ncbi:hypothetical protein B0H14DRAFT_2631028 [Mycena olivaceomarginata]|nr:hypothetical protein B0H14DRAFT_2631028 [Mycena olivaceomarginata]